MPAWNNHFHWNSQIMVISEADRLHYSLKFFKSKSEVNKRVLIRRNSIYDDGVDLSNKKQSYFISGLITLLDIVTLPCFRYISEAGRPTEERILWSLVHITNFCLCLYIVSSGIIDFYETPLVTTLHDTIYPLAKVPFPAIAVCSNNRISLKAATNLAEKLRSKDSKRRSVKYFMEQIKLLGTLYDFDDDDQVDVNEFQTILNQYIFHNQSSLDEIKTLMVTLSPQCSELLERCFWMGEERPCISSTNKSNPPLFYTRRTQHGECCTFNYVRWDNFTSQEIYNHSQYFSPVSGPDMGLMLVVDSRSSDYFYSMYNSVGFSVMVFDPFEYPDLSAGNIVEKSVEPGTETFIRVDGTTINSNTDISQYGIDKRECMFPFESKIQETERREHKRATCILNCRLRSMVALCGCIPFFMLVTTSYDKTNTVPPVCSLQDNPCLNKYIVKWQTVITKIMEVEGLEKEMEDSLYCPECIPSCNDVKYSVLTSSLPLVPQFRKLTGNATQVSDTSIIRIYFGTTETWYYRQDVASYWFEILGNVGAMLGFMAGCSMIALLEIIYFALEQLFALIKFLFFKVFPHLRKDQEFFIYP